MRVPRLKVTLEAGPTTISFTMKNVVLDVSNLLRFIKIKASSGSSTVSATLDPNETDFRHVKRIGAAEIIPTTPEAVPEEE